MMDNTNYLLEFDVPSCSTGFDKNIDFNIPMAASLNTCFCCLATKVPVINASKCNHTEFVKLYFKVGLNKLADRSFTVVRAKQRLARSLLRWMTH